MPPKNKPETVVENQYIDFWQQRYDTGEMPWDLNAPAPYLQHIVQEARYTPGLMVTPGCGRGHDAALFARHNFNVTGVDYAPGAIAAAQALYPAGNWLQADWFYMESQYTQRFDYVLEHPCFCAINPKRRADYVETAHQLLKPNGVLMGIFWDIDDPEGPPFGVRPEALKAYFEPLFEITALVKIPNTLRQREGGEEFFAEMRALPV